jgi:hypothetical protein
MIEVFRTEHLELALGAYQTWVERSIQLGFYPASVALIWNGWGWSVVVVSTLHDAYASTPSL